MLKQQEMSLSKKTDTMTYMRRFNFLFLLLFAGFFIIALLFTGCMNPAGSETAITGGQGTFTITYINMEGASNHTSNPDVYTVQSPAINLEPPLKANVYFVCWRVNNSAGTPVSSIPAGSTGNKTFYAQWTSTEEYNIITETNKVRTNPAGYASMLQIELASISNPGTRSEYQAAIDTLNGVAPRSPVNFERGLYFAARDHADDLIQSNTFSHDSSNGITFSQRIRLYGGSFSYAGENIAAGYPASSSVVKAWVLSPGHLNNIINPNYNQLGASHVSGHKNYNWISVQDFARNFVSNQY